MRYWWIGLVAFLVWYLIRSEHYSQNCLGQKCDNSTPEGQSSDNKAVLIEKTITTVRKTHSLVNWRRALVASFVITLPLLYIFNRRMPTGYTFSIICLIIAIGGYFAYIWFEYSWLATNDKEIERLLGLLK